MFTIHTFARARATALAITVAGTLAAVPAVTAHAQHDPHAGHGSHAGHAGHAAGKKEVTPTSARVTLTDTALLDQDGRSVRVRSDALADRIAVVGFVYTTCTTVCPAISQLMLQAQGKLGARVGRDVAMVTVTVDPVRDTPARLK